MDIKIYYINVTGNTHNLKYIKQIKHAAIDNDKNRAKKSFNNSSFSIIKKYNFYMKRLNKLNTLNTSRQ